MSASSPPSGVTSQRAAVARPRLRRRRRAVAQMVAPMLVFALMIGIWLAISYVLLEPRRRFLMPPPQEVVRVGLLDARNFAEIIAALR